MSQGLLSQLMSGLTQVFQIGLYTVTFRSVAPFAHGLLAAQIRSYLQELEHGDVDAICALFTPDAQIFSPVLGWVQPVPIKAASVENQESTITLIDIWVSTMGGSACYWLFRLRLGAERRFGRALRMCRRVRVDDNGRIGRMIIICDTHPIRSTVGDKYA